MELDLAHLAWPRRLARAPVPETTPAKKCRTCKREKPLTAFATHPRAHDGHRRDCKHCVKAGRVKKPAISTAERTRRERRRRKANPEVKAKNRIAVANWTKRNPIAHKARHAVSAALKRGEIKKPPRCQIRGCSKARTEAHHHDYRAPLAVLWQCRPHHRQLHAGIGLPLKAGIDRKLARIPRELVA